MAHTTGPTARRTKHLWRSEPAHASHAAFEDGGRGSEPRKCCGRGRFCRRIGGEHDSVAAFRLPTSVHRVFRAFSERWHSTWNSTRNLSQFLSEARSQKSTEGRHAADFGWSSV